MSGRFDGPKSWCISQRFALIRVLPFEEIAPSPKPYNGRGEAMQRLLAHAQSWAADGSVDAQTAKRIMAHSRYTGSTKVALGVLKVFTDIPMLCMSRCFGFIFCSPTGRF